MYRVKHDYSNTALSWFSDFLQYLYQNSCREYSIISNNLGESNDFIDKIESFVSCVDDYVFLLVVLGYVDNNNFKDVMEKLSKLRSICPVTDSFRNVDGRIVQNRIQINPNIGSSSNMSADNRTKLCVYYELSRFLHNMFCMDIESFMALSSDMCSNMFDLRQRGYIYKGFELLDVSLAENIALDVLYYSLNKKRPSRSLKYNYNMFIKHHYCTNYEFNGEFQGVTINFGKTLNSVVLDDYIDDNEIMYRFSKNSLNVNFINDMVFEYSKTTRLKEDLLYMLMYLGGIMEARDALLEEEPVVGSNALTDSYLSMFNSICSMNTKCKIKC